MSSTRYGTNRQLYTSVHWETTIHVLNTNTMSCHITINPNSMSCHITGKWITCDIIHFMGKMLDERDAILCSYDNLHRRRSHYFDNAFMTKLLSNRRGYCFKNVATMTKKIDIFTMDKLFFPVNLNNTHWYVRSVCMLMNTYVNQDIILIYACSVLTHNLGRVVGCVQEPRRVQNAGNEDPILYIRRSKQSTATGRNVSIPYRGIRDEARH